MSNNRSRKELDKELQDMKRQISRMSGRSEEFREALQEKARSEETGSSLITLLKYMMNENKNTTMILKAIADKLERIEGNINTEYYEQDDQEPYQQENKLVKVQPISGLDAQIMQVIQLHGNGMVCADDIKKQMSYKGRNAASARLNKLYKLGLLERYQLGHKVYYKFDAGKTTNTLIVSPPQ
ncbi:MAG: hypothetical protein KGI06_02550 [Candidatus Micrarchaeota archaeon]|nr:hypothetical protein [Candidatus Micrarchaeota archaeon]